MSSSILLLIPNTAQYTKAFKNLTTKFLLLGELAF